MELHNRQKTLSGEIPYADCGEDIRYPQGLKWTRQRKSVYKVLWDDRVYYGISVGKIPARKQHQGWPWEVLIDDSNLESIKALYT